MAAADLAACFAAACSLSIFGPHADVLAALEAAGASAARPLPPLFGAPDAATVAAACAAPAAVDAFGDLVDGSGSAYALLHAVPASASACAWVAAFWSRS